VMMMIEESCFRYIWAVNIMGIIEGCLIVSISIVLFILLQYLYNLTKNKS